MFEDIKEEMIRKFRELKLWVSSINGDSQYNVIEHGLFFVYIYGIYEEIVRQVVSTTIDKLNGANITIDKCIYELYSLIFSEEYDGIYSVGNEHKWEKRWKIAEKLDQNEIVIISHDLFPTDGRNLRYRQLDSIAKSFGMKENILPRNEIGGYIQEMVDNRNFIAHGNKSPREVGREYTIDELLKRCEYILEVCTYIVDVYERYIVDQQFLRETTF